MSVQHANRGVAKKNLQLYYNREYQGSFRGESTINLFDLPLSTFQIEGNHSTSFQTYTTTGIPDLVVSGNKNVYYTSYYFTLVATGAWQTEVNRAIIWPKTSMAGSTSYRISFYARSLSGNTALGFAFYGSLINNTANLTTKWQRFEATSTTHPSYPAIEFGNKNAGTMRCQIACVQVESKSYSTPFALPRIWTANFTQTTGTISNTTITKGTPGNGWTNARVYSSEGYSEPCYLSFKASQTNMDLMVGLNSDPGTGIDYNNLDYAWYPNGSGLAYIYESGTNRGSSGPYTTSTIFEIIYDGTNINYYLDGVLARSVVRSGSGPLYLDSSFYNNGSAINSLSFGPLSQINRCSNYVIGGGGLLDISGNRINADLTNVSFDSTGYTFNGSSNYISLGTSNTSLNISSDLTVEAVIKLTSNFTLNPTIVGNGYWQEVYPYKLQFEYNSNNGNLGLFRYDGTNSRYASWNFGSQNTYFLNQTVHVTATYNSLTNAFAIYYNGVSQTITSSNPGNISVNNTTNFAIGVQIKTDGTKGDYFPGVINIVRVYNRALTNAEVLQNFNATRKTYGI